MGKKLDKIKPGIVGYLENIKKKKKKSTLKTILYMLKAKATIAGWNLVD